LPAPIARVLRACSSEQQRSNRFIRPETFEHLRAAALLRQHAQAGGNGAAAVVLALRAPRPSGAAGARTVVMDMPTKAVVTALRLLA
jgi:hypothetical protein